MLKHRGIFSSIVAAGLFAVVGMAFLGSHLRSVEEPFDDDHAATGAYWAKRLGFVNGRIPDGALERALAQRARMLKSVQQSLSLDAAAPANWTYLGPDNLPGHVESFAFDPANPSRMLVASHTGGLWATPDLGNSWTQFPGAVPQGLVKRVAFSTTSPKIAFAYDETNSSESAGLYRSNDGGVTWMPSLTEAQAARMVPKINIKGCQACPSVFSSGLFALSPNEAATSRAVVAMSGYRYADAANLNYLTPFVVLFLSDDLGLSWRVGTIFEMSGPQLEPDILAVYDVARDPNNATNVIVTTGQQVLVSSDGGVSAAASQLPAGPGVHPRITYSKAAPGVVYALMETPFPAIGFMTLGPLYQSGDGGQSWTTVGGLACATSASSLCWASGGGLPGGYGNFIWADPTNPAHLLAGGTRLFRSLDGGQSFDVVGQHLHADTHQLVASPGFDGVLNKTLYVATDRGIAQTSDYIGLGPLNVSTNTYPDPGAAGWTILGDGLGGTQFYDVAASTLGDMLLGAMQDNGCYVTSGSRSWTVMFNSCNDGFKVAFDPDNSAIRYFAANNPPVTRTGIATSAAGITPSAVPIWAGIKDAGTGLTQLALDPNRSSRLYVGTASLWVTDNAKADTVAWRRIKPARAPYPSTQVGLFVSAIAVKRGDPDTVFVGYSDGQIEMTTNATSQSPFWSMVTIADTNRNYVASIDTDPTNSNFFYVSFSNFNVILTGSAPRVAIASNKPYGNLVRLVQPSYAIQDLSAQLPAVPMNGVAVDPSNGSHLYAGSYVGLFESNDAGASWAAVAGGPGVTQVTKVLFSKPAGTVLAATYGNGVWRLSNAAMPTAIVPDAGLWWNASEPGRGYGIQANAITGNLYFAAYQYDATPQGRATWYAATLLPNQSQALGRYSGVLTAYSNAGGAAVGTSLGQMTIDFSSTAQGTITWPQTLTGAATPIQRYALDGVSVKAPQTDQSQWSLASSGTTYVASLGTTYNGWWWDPKNPGSAYMFDQQGALLFAAQFTYRADGSPVWYSATCGALPGSTTQYSCPLAEYAGGSSFAPSGRAPTSSARETDIVSFGCPSGGCLTPTVTGPSQPPGGQKLASFNLY